jgi:hypothetical protein
MIAAVVTNIKSAADNGAISKESNTLASQFPKSQQQSIPPAPQAD